jgi:hypothetical protein
MTPATASDHKPQYLVNRVPELKKTEDRRSTPPAVQDEDQDDLYANIPCTD